MTSEIPMQMSIFDFLAPESNDADLDALPESEMVAIIRKATGIPFELKDDGFREYRAKIKKCSYSVYYSNYNLCENTARFISCGYSMHTADMRGAVAPCDSLEEAIKWFKYALSRNGGER